MQEEWKNAGTAPLLNVIGRPNVRAAAGTGGLRRTRGNSMHAPPTEDMTKQRRPMPSLATLTT